MNTFDENHASDDWINSFSMEDSSDVMRSMPGITHNSTPAPASIHLPPAMQHHQQQTSSSATSSPLLMPSLQVQQQQVGRQPLLRRSSNALAGTHSRSSSLSRPSTLNPVNGGQRPSFVQQFHNLSDLGSLSDRVVQLEEKLSQRDQEIERMNEALARHTKLFDEVTEYVAGIEELFVSVGLRAPSGGTTTS